MAKKILYFINGPVATSAEASEAESMSAVFRNARVAEHDILEHCDGVAGVVPERYAEKFPLVGGRGKQMDERPFNKMSQKELDAKAAVLGISFPKEVNTIAEKATFIQGHIDKA